MHIHPAFVEIATANLVENHGKFPDAKVGSFLRVLNSLVGLFANPANGSLHDKLPIHPKCLIDFMKKL